MSVFGCMELQIQACNVSESMWGAHTYIWESQPNRGSSGIPQQMEQGQTEIFESW